MSDRRRVRRTPLHEKIRNYPYDLYLWINEFFLSIDWEEYNSLAIVLANLTHILFIILNKVNYTPVATSTLFQVDPYQYDKFKQNLLRHSDYNFQTSSKPNGFLVNLTQAAIVLIYGFSVVVTYQLLYKSTRMYSLINSATKPKTPNVRETLINDDSTSRFFQIIASIVKFFNKELEEESYYNDSETTFTDIKVDSNKLVYQIDVWDPSQFNLTLFSFLNPLSLLVVKLAIDLSIWKVILVLMLFNFQSHYLINRFLVLLNDKQILYQEMFLEYNEKFVKPKTNILKQDVGIDATNKYYDSDIHHSNPYYQNTKLKVFIVHDINGKPFNTISKDEMDEERKQLESEKIRFELEKDKFIHEKALNSSMDSDWMRNTVHLTPFKAPTTRDYNRLILRSSDRDARNRSINSSVNRSYVSDTSRRSPTRFGSPVRPVSPVRPGSRYTSPVRNPPSPVRTTSPIRNPTSPVRNSPVRNTSLRRGQITTPTYDTSARFDRTPVNRWR